MTPEAPTLVPRPTTEEATKTLPPWKVLLHDDDVTTFEFVIWLLVKLFGKPFDEAVRLTWEIHTGGVGLVAVTTQERAELYVEQVHSLARPRGFPLTASAEPV